MKLFYNIEIGSKKSIFVKSLRIHSDPAHCILIYDLMYRAGSSGGYYAQCRRSLGHKRGGVAAQQHCPMGILRPQHTGDPRHFQK